MIENDRELFAAIKARRGALHVVGAAQPGAEG
jgi:hypothetical protein